jgi:hypothetical protein
MSRAAQDLVDHLNDHVEYYHKAIWWSMDRDRLFMMLDGFTVPGTNGVSIASVVEREPIGVIGNSLVYRVSGGAFLGLGEIKDANALHNLYAGDQRPRDPMHVSLPTDGLYAQSIMDPCGALEEHYGNTDWPLAQPDIDPGTLAPELFASRRSNPDPTLEPSKMPATLINLQNAPAAPAPAGLQGVLDAVTKGDSFRDITGLAANQANALAALQAASSLATNFGNQAAGLELAKLANRVHATDTADQQLARIDSSKRKGDISAADAASLKKQVIAAGIPGGDTSQGPLMDVPLKGFAEMATQTSGSTLEYKSKDGEFRGRIGSGGDAPPSGGAASGGSVLLGLAERAIGMGSKALEHWGSGADGPLGSTLQEALIAEVDKELHKLASNAAASAVEKCIPFGGALVESLKVSMAFARGLGAELENRNRELGRRYDMAVASVVDSDLTDLTEATADGVVDLGRYQFNAVSSLRELVAAGMREAIDTAVTDIASGLGKILSFNRDAIIRQIAGDSELLAVIDGVVANAIGGDNARNAKLLAYLIRAFVRQLRKSPFKTALETVIKNVRGFSNVASEIVAGLCMVVLDLEGGALRTLLAGFVPDVRAMLMAEATYWLGLGPLPIEPAAPGQPIAIQADKLILPASLASELSAAPSDDRLPRAEMLAAVDTFVNVVQGLQLRVQRTAAAQARRAKNGDETYRDAAEAISQKTESELLSARDAHGTLEVLLRDLAKRAGSDAYSDATGLRRGMRDLGCPQFFYGVRWVVPADGSDPEDDSLPETYPIPLDPT